jgi:hypothetical protein
MHVLHVSWIYMAIVRGAIYMIYNRSEAQPQLEKVRHETKIKIKNCEPSSQLYILHNATKERDARKR